MDLYGITRVVRNLSIAFGWCNPRRHARPEFGILLKGQEPPDWRKSFYYEYYEYPQPHHVRPHYGVITDRYKLAHFQAPDLDEWELFDLKIDPQELRNAIDDPANAKVVADLKAEVARLRTELKVPATPPAEAFGQAARPATKKASPHRRDEFVVCSFIR